MLKPNELSSNLEKLGKEQQNKRTTTESRKKEIIQNRNKNRK
jgi:hypothetical protein